MIHEPPNILPAAWDADGGLGGDTASSAAAETGGKLSWADEMCGEDERAPEPGDFPALGAPPRAAAAGAWGRGSQALKETCAPPPPPPWGSAFLRFFMLNKLADPARVFLPSCELECHRGYRTRTVQIGSFRVRLTAHALTL